MEGEDPWFWDTERVIKEFCSSTRSWPDYGPSQRLPDPVTFAAILRDNTITGNILLNDLYDDAALRDEFGVRNFGIRSTIKHAIRYLRTQSSGYATYHEIVPDFKRRCSGLDSIGKHEDVKAEDSAPDQHNSMDNHSIENETVACRGVKRKRATLQYVGPATSQEPRALPTEADTVIEYAPGVPQPGQITITDSGKKRMLHFSTQAPGLTKNIVDRLRAEYAQLQAGGVSGRAAAEAIIAKKTIKAEQASLNSTSLDTGYLGKQSMVIDHIFCGSEPEAGSEINLDLSLKKSFSEQYTVSAGRRIYMNQVMKTFLRATPVSVRRNGELSLTKQTHQARLTPQHHNPSFILVQRNNDDKLIATRGDLSQWPEFNPEAKAASASVLEDNSRLSKFHVPGEEPADLAGQLGSKSDDWNESMLEKYRYAEGADEVLPLFGDSDSENDYDFETWQEIERENPGTEKENIVSKSKRTPLSEEQVEQAINEGIAALVIKWNEEKRYKCEVHAYKLWHQCHKAGTRKEVLEKHQRHLTRLNNDRLIKLTKEIMGEQWTRAAHVHQQTKCMEQSIFDREEAALLAQVLDSKKRPAKPADIEDLRQKAIAAQQARREKEMLQDDGDDDDGESLGSDSDVPDELDDFIVSDDLDEGDSFSVQNFDADSSSDSESSDSNESIVLPTPHPQLVTESEQQELSELPVIKDEFRTKTKAQASTASTQPEIISLLSSDNERTPSPDPFVVGPSPVKRTFSDPRNLDADTPLTPKSDSRNLDADTPLTPESRFQAVVTTIENAYPLKLLLSEVARETVWKTMIEVLERVVADNTAYKIQGVDRDTFNTYKSLIRLFGCYIKDLTRSDEVIFVDSLLETCCKAAPKWFKFYETCLSILKNMKAPRPTQKWQSTRNVFSDESEASDDMSSPNSDSERRRGQPRPGKGIKIGRRIIEDADARDEREADRRRRAEQDQRRQRLHAKLSQPSASTHVHDTGIIINDAAEETDNFVYIHPTIAPRIETHQTDGVRFMWSQIVEGNKGCLLAHTMGLGKTMQVVTFLVAINEATDKSDVRDLIPERLRRPRVLILCPPTLIDNWMDELCQWAPSGSLGELRKIDSTTLKSARFQELQRWHRDRGVLVMGYEMFRDLILKESTNHDKIKEYLLDGPSLVVADEAHKMKNMEAKISKAAAMIKTTSRIALTGSPLSNHVIEYHSMIEWVSPNYLGPVAEFKAKYADPIERGNYADCTSADRSRAKKMLKVLMREVEPKVQRRDTSVLRHRLPPKLEFVLSVPLTSLQEQAYNLYVEAMLATDYDQNKDGQVTNTTLWSWLAVLSLLCNHPQCFVAKLEDRKAKAEKFRHQSSQHQQIRPVDDDSDEINDPNLIIPDSLAKKLTELFATVPNITSASLSNKVAVLVQILDESKAAGDKVLIFSLSLFTLDYLEKLCIRTRRTYARLDGKTKMSQRQGDTKAFNTGDTEVYLISTTAGGLGLNLQAANRVVIFDFAWTPTGEEQAIGRAYRLGQTKSVFVYRFLAAGTFETKKHMRSVYKTQLASKVVDKKNPMNWARKSDDTYLARVKAIDQEDLSQYVGRDPQVFDKIIKVENGKALKRIRKVELTTVFEDEDDLKLTPEEEADAERMIKLEALKRNNPAKYEQELAAYQRHLFTQAHAAQHATVQVSQHAATMPASQMANTNIPAQVAQHAAVQAAQRAATMQVSRIANTNLLQHQVNGLKSGSINVQSASTSQSQAPAARSGGQEPIMAGGTDVFKGRPPQPPKEIARVERVKTPQKEAEIVELADEASEEQSLFVSPHQKSSEWLTTSKSNDVSRQVSTEPKSMRGVLPPPLGGNDGARSPRPHARGANAIPLGGSTVPRRTSSISSTQPEPESKFMQKLRAIRARKVQEKQNALTSAAKSASALPSWAVGAIEEERSLTPEAREAARNARKMRAGSILPPSSTAPPRPFKEREMIEID